MRALIQRVAGASVSVNGVEVGRTGKGLVVLLSVSREDDEEDARYLVEKTVNLRIFPDHEHRFNCSALDTGAELLVVSPVHPSCRHPQRPTPGLHPIRTAR